MPEGPPLLDQTAAPTQPLNGHDVEPVEAYPAGDYSVVKLMNTDELCRSLFPKFVERATGFIDRMGVTTDKVWIGQLLYNSFATRSPHVLMLVALDSESKIVAHAIVLPEIQGTEGWVAQVLQLEKDRDIHDDEIFKVGHEIMEKWTRGLGMTKMFNQTNKVARARYFERFGYEIKRWVSVKDLSKEG